MNSQVCCQCENVVKPIKKDPPESMSKIYPYTDAKHPFLAMMQLMFNKKDACPVCGSFDLVPLDSPKGKRILQQQKETPAPVAKENASYQELSSDMVVKKTDNFLFEYKLCRGQDEDRIAGQIKNTSGIDKDRIDIFYHIQTEELRHGLAYKYTYFITDLKSDEIYKFDFALPDIKRFHSVTKTEVNW